MEREESEAAAATIEGQPFELTPPPVPGRRRVGIQVNLRIGSEQLAQLDSIVDRENQQQPWRKITRSDAMRRVLHVGLRLLTSPGFREPGEPDAAPASVVPPVRRPLEPKRREKRVKTAKKPRGRPRR